MEKTLINDGQNRQLRLEKEPVPEKMYEVRMILHNRPQGLLSFRAEETPEGLRCDYHVSGLKSLKESIEEEDTDYLYSVLFSLERLAGVFYEYLLSPDRLMLEPDTIFLKKETGVVYFCYYPAKSGTFQEALQSLMEYFLKIRNPSKEEDVLLLYGLYQRSREADVTMTSLAEYWRETEKRTAAEKREEEDLLYAEDPEISVRGPVYEEGGGDRRLYEDLGLQIPEKDSAFARWKRRNEPPSREEELSPYRENRHRESAPGRYSVPDTGEYRRTEFPANRGRQDRERYDREYNKEEDAGRTEALKQYVKQNYIQITAVILVLGFILWFLLN